VSDPTPRDPLQHATLSVPEGERIESAVPVAYRLANKKGDFCMTHPETGLAIYYPPNLVLQGAFKTYNAQGMLVFEWRDIPTVELP